MMNKGMDLSAANMVSESLKRMGSSKSYLHAIIDSLEDELLVVDKDYRIVQANETVLRRHGKRRQEGIGRHYYDISHGLCELCRPPGHECPIKAVWETGKPVRVIRPLTDEWFVMHPSERMI